MNVTINGSSVAVDVTGQGEPILFVHGFPLDHRMWQGQVSVLGSSRQVIVPDLPGFGESEPSPHAMSMDGYADWLRELLDTLGVQRPVTLCGLSMGGYIAFSFFRRYRDRVSGLILCDTKATADPPEKQRDRESTAEDVLRNGVAKLGEAMPKVVLAPTTQERRPDLVALTKEMIGRASPVGVAAASRAMASRADSTDLLARIDVPTLVLCGEDDSISPPTEMRLMAERIPNARFMTVPLAGHLCPMENQESVNEAIRGFLK